VPEIAFCYFLTWTSTAQQFAIDFYFASWFITRLVWAVMLLFGVFALGGDALCL